MIVKTKDIGLNQSLTVQALEPPQNVQGKYGPQLQWRVQCNGQEGTMYTPVYPEGPDKIGRALASGEPVTITRVWDAAKNKAVLQTSGANVAPAPSPAPAFGPPPTFPAHPAPKAAPVPWQGTTKKAEPSDREKGIAYLALFKALATPQDTPHDNHQRTVAAYEEMQKWLAGGEEEVPDFLAEPDGMPFDGEV